MSPVLGAHVTVSDECLAQLTPGIEEGLVDRVAVGIEFDGQGIDRYAVENDGYKQPPLSGSERLVDGPAQSVDQLLPLSPLLGVKAERSR